MASRVRKATRKTKRTRKTTRNSGSKKLKSHFRRPTTAHQYFRLAPKDQETWDSVTHVVSRMRDGVSLPKASKEFDVAPSTVAELARSALRMRNGRYVPTKNDRLLRVLSVLSVKGGKREIATRDFREATKVGGHWAAVQRYLQTGDDSALLRFKGKTVIDAGGKRHLLLTDLKELDRLASAGVLSFESIYPGGSR